jgi:hypothetical protein
MSQIRLQADSVTFFTSGKEKDVGSRYKYLALTVVQGPHSAARSLCSHHLSFYNHLIIYSKIDSLHSVLTTSPPDSLPSEKPGQMRY